MAHTLTVGIDVSVAELVVAVRQEKAVTQHTFENTTAGHTQLCSFLTKRGRHATVGLEATGIYSLDLALALHRHPRIQVMVLNPRAVHNFAKALLTRGKSDPIDAEVVLAFVERMPFQPWQPPSEAAMAVRSISRRIEALNTQLTAEKNRLHAADHNAELPAVLRDDIEEGIAQLKMRMAKLEEQALAFIAAHAELAEKLALLQSVVGIAERSGIALLSELAILPPDMDVRQWVAHAGLDPKPVQSGTSVRKPEHISKAGNAHLRRALYMPALVAVRHEPAVAAFHQRLVERGKAPMQANVAVMRKLLHAIYGIFRTNMPFDGVRCFTNPTAPRGSSSQDTSAPIAAAPQSA